MEARVIPGRLKGRFKLSGAKNSALKLMTASLLTQEDIVLQRFPESILDARIHIDMLKQLGKP